MNREILKEKRVHGNAMFPLQVYKMNVVGRDTVLDCHWHEELEFLIVTEGKGAFQIETSSYELHEGQAIFINSSKIHGGTAIDSSPCSYCAIVFNPNLLCSNSFDGVQSKYFDPLLQDQYLINEAFLGRNGWETEVISCLKKIVYICDTKPYTYELSIKALLYHLFSIMFSNGKPCHSSSKYALKTYKTERIKEIIKYIQSNYKRKITIKELATYANMSEGHFCRSFKEMIHKTPVDYINYYRITRASHELVNSTKKIYQIAMESGFDNFSYFINIFRNYMNCTPSEYRQNNFPIVE